MSRQLAPLTKFLVFLLTTIAVIISNDTRFLVLLAIVSMFIYLHPKVKPHIIFLGLIGCHLVILYLINPSYAVTLYHYNISWIYDFTLQDALYLLTIMLKDIVILNFLTYFIISSRPLEISASLAGLGVPYRLAYKIGQLFTLVPRLKNTDLKLKQAATAQNQTVSTMTKMRFYLKVKQNKTLSMRHFGKKSHRTWSAIPTLSRLDHLVLLLAMISVIISISLIFINGSRLWNPFL
ncbi:hypothetical protein [Pseudolactococcus paracarnosus]|uniref:Transmembrane component MtsC of energizing module of methionine-regulated ECF transporter n=1 Tax=Pseudolactococcus paracarnosus TaxID=2749962 RepID=A0A7L4WE90_9LACT|nr:hypothetical protein [Lactococcus paracarnosus]SPC35411.1 Transmembrane component MtsC of energizing module of methionine-regulated ECF transporter [Lactococcus piscium]MCJ1977617.1 hypothetical protein [Lactococcus paracarnosus]MCJ1983760.1 hypothetical protein [Lactococcus paracarnosus]MCJ1994937.1 hypothetical protein [Lactococcus paracarnosus]MCJ1998805.1 hypothetical protein [Lactococcus paracarnosus]